jgi:hypothetical protein
MVSFARTFPIYLKNNFYLRVFGQSFLVFRPLCLADRTGLTQLFPELLAEMGSIRRKQEDKGLP